MRHSLFRMIRGREHSKAPYLLPNVDTQISSLQSRADTHYLSESAQWGDDTIHCDAPNAKLYARSLDLMPSYSGAIAYRLPKKVASPISRKLLLCVLDSPTFPPFLLSGIADPTTLICSGLTKIADCDFRPI